MIDEKKIIKRFKALQGADTLAWMLISDVIKEIERQAKKESYDVDKVVESLKEEGCISDNVAGNRAVEIILKGGAE